MRKHFQTYQIQLITMMIFLFGFTLFGIASAGEQQKFKKPVPQKIKLKKCDLIVEKIELDKNCMVKVTIKNQGSAGVADAAYDSPPKTGVAIQAIAENSGWGGYILNIVDPKKLLKTPGASVSFTGFKRALNPQEILSVKMMIINTNNVANESNLNNNSKTVSLTCRQKQCDLIVERIELDKNCMVKVTIKNQGSAGVADGAYNLPPNDSVAVQAIAENSGWGGYTLNVVDPSKLLKTPGASVSLTGFKRALNPQETLSVKMTIINVNNVANESNLNNNSKTVSLTCRKK
jgi:predicted DNA-binding transcriptional regulator